MISTMFERFSPLQRSLLSSFAGFIVYGSWAYMVNSMHGVAAGVKAACVQGGYSFALTFVMTMLIEMLYRCASRYSESEKAASVLTIVATCAIIFSTSWWVNVIAGTPEIFNTVILGYVFGGIYTCSYVVGLSKARRRQKIQ